MKILKKGSKYARRYYKLAPKLLLTSLSSLITPTPTPEPDQDIYPWLVASNINGNIVYLLANKSSEIDYNSTPQVIKNTLDNTDL